MDICNDYSFWNDSKKCYHDGNNVDLRFNPKYTHAKLCSTYNINQITKRDANFANNCYNNPWWMSSYIPPNCPNSDNEATCKEKGKHYYFCSISKTCIERTKLCDGIIHCLRAEDEALDICEDRFPFNAFVVCNEADRPANNVWIKAVPCNGIVECRNGEDEGWYCQRILVSYFPITYISY